MEILVNELLENHGGGKKFFTELKEALCNDDVCAAVHALIKDPHRYTFVLEGPFGQRFLNWMIRTSKAMSGYIVFPGGMRDGVQRSHTYLNVRGAWNHGKVCFVNDTFYSGKAYETCKERLQVPPTLPVYVAFDGSPVQLPNVSSLYRYFNYYDAAGNLVVPMEEASCITKTVSHAATQAVSYT